MKSSSCSGVCDAWVDISGTIRVDICGTAIVVYYLLDEGIAHQTTRMREESNNNQINMSENSGNFLGPIQERNTAHSAHGNGNACKRIKKWPTRKKASLVSIPFVLAKEILNFVGFAINLSKYGSEIS